MPAVKEAPKVAETSASKPQTATAEGTKGEPMEIARRAPLLPSLWMGDPFGALNRFADEIDRFFGDFDFGFHWHRPRFAGLRRALRRREKELEQAAWSPRVDILEQGGQLVVRADLPGLTKDNIKVEVTDDTLTIQGEREQKKEEKREGYYRSECSYGSFYRAIPLPEGADTAKAGAVIRDGVLEVTMPAPKREEARARPIEVQEPPKAT
jgi:HSP20 family protein